MLVKKVTPLGFYSDSLLISLPCFYMSAGIVLYACAGILRCVGVYVGMLGYSPLVICVPGRTAKCGYVGGCVCVCYVSRGDTGELSWMLAAL